MHRAAGPVTYEHGTPGSRSLHRPYRRSPAPPASRVHTVISAVNVTAASRERLTEPRSNTSSAATPDPAEAANQAIWLARADTERAAALAVSALAVARASEDWRAASIAE